PDLANIGRQNLERLGYKVDCMTNSLAALDAFRATPNQWSVVVTDYMMPTLNGLQLAQEIVRIRPDLPILLCTGYADALNRDAALSAGIREFVLKPLAGRELAKLIRTLIDARDGN